MILITKKRRRGILGSQVISLHYKISINLGSILSRLIWHCTGDVIMLPLWHILGNQDFHGIPSINNLHQATLTKVSQNFAKGLKALVFFFYHGTLEVVAFVTAICILCNCRHPQLSHSYKNLGLIHTICFQVHFFKCILNSCTVISMFHITALDFSANQKSTAV